MESHTQAVDAARVAGCDSGDTNLDRYNLDGEALWGTSSRDALLRSDIAEATVERFVGPGSFSSGVTKYAEPFRTNFRDFAFVPESAELPRQERVVQKVPCTVGHPGICCTRDAADYVLLGVVKAALLRFVFNNLAPIGGLMLLEAFDADDEHWVRRGYFMTAYLRRRDPITVVFVKASLVDGVFDFAREPSGLVIPSTNASEPR